MPHNLIPTEFLIFHPKSDIPRVISILMPRQPTNDLLKTTFGPWLAADTNWIEHFKVLFNNGLHDMFADAEGSLYRNSRPPLMVNEEATRMYHAYGTSQGARMSGVAPKVYGVAILSMRKIWL